MEQKRRRVVEFNPALETMDEVVRHAGFHIRALRCSDPMLKPMLERAAEGCRAVSLNGDMVFFKFDPQRPDRRFAMGQKSPTRSELFYEWIWAGAWAGIVCEAGTPESHRVVRVPPYGQATGQDLLDAVNLLEVQKVMDR